MELLELLRWKANPNAIVTCIDNLLKIDGLEVMKVREYISQIIDLLATVMSTASNVGFFFN